MSEEEQKKININQEEYENESQNPLMIFRIDVGNGKEEQLKLYSLDNPEKDIYEFCSLYKLDFETMQDISNQLDELIKEKQYQSNNNTTNSILKSRDLEDNNKSIKNKKLELKKDDSNKKIFNKDILNHNKLGLFQYEMKDYQNPKRNNEILKNNSTRNKKINYGKKSLNNSKNKDNNLLNKFSKDLIKESEMNKNKNDFDINKYIETHLKIKENKLNSLNNENDNPNINNKNNEEINELKSKTPKNFVNRGFYDKNCKYNDLKRKKIETLKNNINDDEKDIYTFQPEINKMSQTAINKREEVGNKFNNPDIINKYKDYKEKKIEKCKEKQIKNKVMEDYSFKPSLNEISENAFNNRKEKGNEFNNPNIINNYDKYQKQKIEKCKEKQIKYNVLEDYSYKPKINNNKITESFIKRLKLYENISKEKKQKIINEIEELNNNLRKPVLYNNKKYNINTERNKNRDLLKNKILYNKKRNEKQKKELKKKKLENLSFDNKKKLNKSSNNLLINKKGKSFQKLFTLLDGDEDGLITSSAMNVERIPKSVQEVLKNLFKQIKEENECLDRSEFLYICDEYFKMLPYEKQNAFVNFEVDTNNVNINENYTFKPNINENSRRIDKFLG